jgi:hypothetical protein
MSDRSAAKLLTKDDARLIAANAATAGAVALPIHKN